MHTFLDVQRKLLPDLLEIMQKRYRILQYIQLMQPIGRRSLATSLKISERVLRAEVQFLKGQNLIVIHSLGMSVTADGILVLRELEDMIREYTGLKELEEKLRQKLNLNDVVVVLGDSDKSSWVKKEMGKACVERIYERLLEKNIIAVTGGTSIAAVAEMMTPSPNKQELLFVPARGGLDENVANQANMICATMAEKAMVNYRLLYVPDQVSHEAYQSIIDEPSIKEVLHLIKSSSMVIHGIGDAKTMALRRRTAPHDMEKIEQGHAVAEAFGYYFNQNGEIVHKVQTIGLQLADLKNIDCVIAVAGGTSKAKAIEAYFKQANNTLLITDEGAAKQLLQG
jgi:central glycolytic genes regulator